MTTKTLVATLLLFFITTGIMAQEKYEYIRVALITTMGKNIDGIYISYSNKPGERVESETKKINNIASDYGPLLNYIQTLTDSGWEIFANDGGNIFYLRKKKN